MLEDTELSRGNDGFLSLSFDSTLSLFKFITLSFPFVVWGNEEEFPLLDVPLFAGKCPDGVEFGFGNLPSPNEMEPGMGNLPSPGGMQLGAGNLPSPTAMEPGPGNFPGMEQEPGNLPSAIGREPGAGNDPGGLLMPGSSEPEAWYLISVAGEIDNMVPKRTCWMTGNLERIWNKKETVITKLSIEISKMKHNCIHYFEMCYFFILNFVPSI